MFNNLLRTLLAILIFSNSALSQSPTALAQNFNVFLQKDANLTTNESEGGIALGGNLTVSGNYQVNIHGTSTFTVGTIPIGLFVGGKLNLSSGSLKVNSNSYVKIGNCAASNIKVWYLDNNNAASNIYITGNSSSYGSDPSININHNNNFSGTTVSASNNPICDPSTSTYIDFTTAFTTFKSKAASLATCSTTNNILSNPNQNQFGSTISSVLTGGQVKITLASGTNVLNVTGADLNNVTNGITFTNQPDANHVLVINVDASGTFNWSVWNQAGISGNNALYIIYNFYNTTTLNIQGSSTIEGTVFAPYADIVKTVNQSNIEGQVIGQSFTQSGGEVHSYPFTPSVAGCAVACVNPTIYNVTGGGAYCNGGAGVAVGLDNSESGVTYQLYKNGSTIGSPVSGNGSAVSFGNQSSAGSYTVVATRTPGSCTSNMTGNAVIAVKNSTTAASLTTASCISFYWHSKTYTTSGVYTDTIKGGNSVGCDSIGTLNLTISQPTSSSKIDSICAGSSYTFNGKTYTNSGTYKDTIKNVSGCDSITTLVLKVNPLPTTPFITGNNSFCFGDSSVLSIASNNYNYQWRKYFFGKGEIPIFGANAATYTATQSGIYSVVATDKITGCISISANDTITVFSKPSTPSVTVAQPACGAIVGTITITAPLAIGNTYSIDGVNYQSATTFSSLPPNSTYNVTVKNSTNCISDAYTATINSITTNVSTTKTDSICAGGLYTFNSKTYSTAGTYSDTLKTVGGCDSITTLILKVTPIPATPVIIGTSKICSGDSALLTATAGHLSYQWYQKQIGANHAYPITGATNATYIAKQTGIYTVLVSDIPSGYCGATSNGDTVTVLASSTSTNNVTTCNSYVWNGNTYNTSGTYTFKTTNAVGCDSTATLNLIINKPSVSFTLVTVCESTLPYIWNGKAYDSANTYTVHFNNSVGCDSSAVLILTVSKGPSVDSITGPTSACAGDTVRLSDSTVGGWWLSADTSIATVDSLSGLVKGIKNGNTIITYNFSVIPKTPVPGFGSCISVAKFPFSVSCGVTPGGGGGLESRSVGNAISKRIYNNAINSINTTINYATALPVKRSTNITYGAGQTLKLADIIPTTISSRKAWTATTSTPSDIISFTNAIDVLAYDYNNKSVCKAVAFGTTTTNEVYWHTKPVCDRLKGATLVNVEQVNIKGFNFIRYKLLQASGEIEYAISFTASTVSGRNSFTLQSNWLNNHYTAENTMYNFQLWSAEPQVTNDMVGDILANLLAVQPINQINGNDIPATYVTKGSRNGVNLDLTVLNNTIATSAYIQLEEKANEQTKSATRRIIPVTINANGVSNVTIPVFDKYESTISLIVNGVITDVVYMNDGTWDVAYNTASNTTIKKFEVANDANFKVANNEYTLMRNVTLSAATNSYVALTKLVHGGGMAQDLSSYKNMVLQAQAYGASAIKITLVKKGITDWNSQYTYTLPVNADINEYAISLNDFKSVTIASPINANDIVQVIFTYEVNGGTNITASLSKVRFTKEDVVYERSLSSKSLTVYPNPANGKFNVSFMSDKATTVNMTITELATGKTVLTKAVTTTIGNNIVPVILEQKVFAPTYYTISVNGDGTKYDRKMILITNK